MRRRFIVGAMAGQLLLLFVMAGTYERILRSAPEIILRTAPIDPTDPMRGDYAVFHYEIADIPRRLCRDDLPAMLDRDSPYYYNSELRDSPVYARLAEDPGSISQITSLSNQRPSGGLYMEGFIVRSSINGVSVRWGIESYYMEEGSSAKLLAKNSGEMAGVPIYAKVAVSSAGKSLIKSFTWAPLGLTLAFEHRSVAPETGKKAIPRRINIAADATVRNVSDGPMVIATGANCFRLVAEESIDRMGRDNDSQYVWVGADRPREEQQEAATTLRREEKYTFHLDFENPRWFVKKILPRGEFGPPVSITTLPEPERFRIEYDPPRLGPVGTMTLGNYIRLRSRVFNGFSID